MNFLNKRTLVPIIITSLLLTLTSIEAISWAASTPTTDLSSTGAVAAENDFEDDDPDSQTYDCSEWVGSDTVYAWHKHGYINTGGPDDDYYLFSLIYRFRLYLDDDFVENVDLDDLMCATPTDGELVTCDGGETEYDGGTIIELNLESRGDDGNYIQWTYGQDDFDDIPILPGINYYDAEYDYYDTADPSERTFSEVVSFTFKDDVESGATATTTGSVQIKHKAMHKDTDEWIEIEDSDGNIDWHWNEHTYTLVTDYICELECVDLDMEPYATLTEQEARSDVEITVSSEDTYGDDWEDASEFNDYRYWALDYEGGLADGEFYTSWADIWGENPMVDDDNHVYYEGGSPGDQIFVCALDQDDNCISACQAGVDSPICSSLEMDPDSIETESIPYSIDFTITSTDSGGGTWYGYASWETDSPSGSFSDDETGTNTTVTYSDEESEVTVSVYDNEFPDICYDSATIEFIPSLACLYLEITEPTQAEYSDLLGGRCFDVVTETYNDDGTERATVICYEVWDLDTGALSTSTTLTNIYGRTTVGKMCTTSPEVEVCNSSENDMIYVYDMFDEAICYDRLIPEAEEIICAEMTLTPSGSMETSTAAYTIDMTLETYGSDGNLWEGIAVWTLDSSTASLDPPSPTDTNTTAVYTETSQGEDTTYCVHVEDSQYPSICYDDLCITRPGPGGDGDGDGDVDIEENPGEISKSAESYNFYGSTISHYTAHDLDYIYYSVTYTAGTDPDPLLVDDLSGTIYGESSDSRIEYFEGTDAWGNYVTFELAELDECTEDDHTNEEACYELTNSSNPLEGIQFYYLEEGDEINMTYGGRVYSTLCDGTNEDECLANGITNTVTAYEDSFTLEATSTITIICPFILTRNAGDVYFEGELSTGTNAECVYDGFIEGYDMFKNSDGLVMIDEALESIVGDTFKHFSTYISEIFYQTLADWQVTEIEDTTNWHVYRSTYNISTTQAETDPESTEIYVYDWNDLEQIRNTNTDENIYYYESPEGSRGEVNFNLNGNKVPEGAHTIIIKDADLVITTDIEYEDASFGFNYYTYSADADYDNLGSVAFILLGDSDMYVSHWVYDLVGVYYLENGSIYSGTPSNPNYARSPISEQLRIFGSVYGDVEPVLEDSGFVGPIELDHGAVVIRYDERVILNTPPGLAEYIDFYSYKTAR